MKPLWTGSGKFFGYAVDMELRTYVGKHIGIITGHLIHDENGQYMGEIKGNRLIKSVSQFRFPLLYPKVLFGNLKPIKKEDDEPSLNFNDEELKGYTDFPVAEIFEKQ